MAAHGFQFSDDKDSLFVDVPPRMFNTRQWPNLVRLYDHLGIEYEPVDLSKSYSTQSGECYLTLDAALRPQKSLSLLTKPVRAIGYDAKRMMELVTNGLPVNPTLTFRDFLESNHFSTSFINQFLYPTLASTVCTCSYDSLDGYPAKLMLESLVSIVGDELDAAQALYRTRHGSTEVVRKLAPPQDSVSFETTVVNAKPNESGVVVVCERDKRQFEVDVDHLVVATQANHCLKFLSKVSDEERQMLDTFEYETIETVLHSDETLMPLKKSQWAHFNFLARPETSMCSVWMNRFNPSLKLTGNLFQTIGPFINANEESVYAKRSLQRPVVTHNSHIAWDQIEAFHREPNRKIWFCGSYAAAGLPLLESGVVSSLNVVEAMNIDLPMAFGRVRPVNG